MTVIAWDGKTLAGDRQRTISGTRGRARKVYRITGKDGRVRLAGCSGNADDCVAFIRWLKGGEQPKPKDFEAIVIDGGRIWMIENALIYYPVGRKFFAIGSGADYALGAMAAGKDAIGAVRIASALTPTCGMGVDHVTLAAAHRKK